MKKVNYITLIVILLSVVFSFSAYAIMKDENGDFVRSTPLNQDGVETGKQWTWLNDETCVQYEISIDITKTNLGQMFDLGMISRWAEDGSDGRGVIKTRDTYSGKWSQSADGIWSFTFDDYTIPVGVTKIDGVLYAFNGFGGLQDGYEYYTGYKTGADGLVTADSAEFQAWLATQYVPDCTSN